MRKKTNAFILILLSLCFPISGCSSPASGSKVGMLTSTGIIEGQSFSSGVWSGIQQAKKDFSFETVHAKPEAETPDGYLKEADTLYTAGYRMIVAPGAEFSKTVFDAQSKYSDARFILIDGEPSDAGGNVSISQNTVALLFAEQESGFLAAVASALQLKTGHFAVILSSKDPSLSRYKNGFVQGVNYANKNFGTGIALERSDFVFINGPDDLDGAKKAAGAFYDRGVDAIFTPCGAAAGAVISEAVERSQNGTPAFVVGTDSDLYDDGIYDGKKSVLLTSAVKKADAAAYYIIEKIFDNQFPGGQTVVLNTGNGGVGLPESNPNLREDVIKTVNLLLKQLKSGDLTVNE